ncbi:M23 family metallopeptidase [Opitutus sp. ER46]|uniref:M23 family metallopeptidase n=1 Tax=Opitutus sp. ER46 TaxID=2161864 RepID=UPI000D2FB0FC|nr:M23 family metallopeptidase [Opitutus sp. ER46]PTX91126.1 M23 family peptidase [Opitutus sp. ER46]
MSRLLTGLFALLFATSLYAQRMQLVWPSPNHGWTDGRSPDAFLQHAGSGDPASGGFGGVRSGGNQFHEGIDIACVARDRRGEPKDDVYAALDGVVRHISVHPGNSSYGRYVVLEHPEQSPAVYSLYAHLSRIAPGLKVGDQVKAGTVLGTLGYSAERPFPRDRAHLHFEFGLMVTQRFQRWYDLKGYGSRNEHGVWNGMNLMGIDPLAVFNDWRAGRVNNMHDVFARQVPAVRLRIGTPLTPDFITRYPALLTRPMPLGPIGGWEITFNWTGIPYAWTPLSATEALGLPRDKPLIMEVDAGIEKRERSKALVAQRRGQWITAQDLDTVLQQLFGRK